MPSDFFEFSIAEYRIHDNVPTMVFERTLPTTSFARVYAQAVGARDNGDHRTFYRTVSCLRGGGSPSVSSAVDVHSPIGNAGSSTWDLTFGVVGNNVQVRVTSQDLATVLWQLKITVFFVSPN
jgi:hypothetical protein